MKLILEIKDNKAAFFMELLKNFSYVKAKPISDEKALLIGEIKEAVQNLKLVREGKLKARPAKDIITEIPINYSKEPNALALKGIWKDRKINQKELRKKAWR